MSKRIVVGLGEVLWDVYPDQALFGGAPANFACHAASLGADSRILSAVGKDRLGIAALDWMIEHELSIDCIEIDSEHPTGSVKISLDRIGTPEYQFAPDVAWDFLEFQPYWSDLAFQCEAVCFGTLAQRSPRSHRAVMGFLDATGPETLRVFDVNLRQSFYSREVLLSSMQRANVLKLNHEELPVVAGLLGISETSELLVCQRLATEYSLRAVALTRGADGSAVLLDGDWDEQLAPEIQAIDTVGAGDAFSASLIMGILEGKSLAKVHSHAARIAAYVCTQRGAVVPLPESLLE